MEFINVIVTVVTSTAAGYVNLGIYKVFVPAVVNFGKMIGVVRDGTADLWAGILEVAGFVTFVGLGLYSAFTMNVIDLGAIDTILVSIGTVLVTLVTLGSQLKLNQWLYPLWKKYVPNILGGFSFSR